jgi:hypothetical protein
MMGSVEIHQLTKNLMKKRYDKVNNCKKNSKKIGSKLFRLNAHNIFFFLIVDHVFGNAKKQSL